jgi:hypothetical protein
MSTALRFQEESKRRIAANIYPLDRIHLDGDFKAPAICHVRVPVV